MSTWILEAEIAGVFLLVLLPIVVLPGVYLHYRRFGRFSGWPAVLSILTLGYLCGLVAFTMFPLPDADTGFCGLREEISYWQLVPLHSLSDIVDVVRVEGVVGTLTSTVFLQVALNVVLLVPLGMLLAHRYRRSFGFTVGVGLGVSLLIELTQGTGVWGVYGCPYRLADVDDLLTNTVGVALGWALGRTLDSHLPDPNPVRVPDLEPPSVVRRVCAGVLDAVGLVVAGLAVQIVVLVAVEAIGRDAGEVPDAVLAFVGVALPALALFLLMPLLRGDRATPGQVSTWLAAVKTGEAVQAISPRSAVIRFAVRWGPLVVLATIQPLAALVVVAVAEAATVAARKDRRSLSGVAAGETTTTRRRLESADVEIP